MEGSWVKFSLSKHLYATFCLMKGLLYASVALATDYDCWRSERFCPVGKISYYIKTVFWLISGVGGNSHGNATQGLGKLKTADFSRHSLKGHHRLVTRHQVAKDTCNSSVMLPFIKELQSYLSKVFRYANANVIIY
jgi:hypothetical protein